MKTKSIFKSFLSVILSVAMISVLVLSPMLNVGAAESSAHTQPGDGKVYIYKTGGYGEERWGNNNFYAFVNVVSGKTYTFTALWKAGTNDKTLFNVNDTTIVNGSYNVQNGATFNPSTGRISYTFVASSDKVLINLENRGDEIQEKNYSFADPQIFESDPEGNATVGGDIADCDVDFCDTIWSYDLNWNHDKGNRSDYVTTGKVADFRTNHDQLSGSKVYAYSTGYSYDAFYIGKSVYVESGKKYKFSLLWKTGSKDSTQVYINDTKILAGSYNVQNGATYNPYTGRLEYIFEASDSSVNIIFDNRGDGDTAYIKEHDYIIADPQIFEVDDNGNTVENGYIAECDVDFCQWGYGVWGDLTYDGLKTTEMNISDFVQAEKKEFEYDTPESVGEEGDVWVFSYKSGWNKRQYKTDVYVIAGKRYNFNMLWKDLGNCESIVRVNGTVILDGGYNVLNGAVFNPSTGRLSYTFTAAGTVVSIEIENFDHEYNKNYSFADPRMYEVDSNGAAVANGDVADCDGDFDDDAWLLLGPDYKEASTDGEPLSTVAGNSADFILRDNHSGTTADGKTIALSEYKDFTEKSVSYSPFVFKGRTYTFSMYYKVLEGTGTKIYVDGTMIFDGAYNAVSATGAKYDPYTGLITYTFTAASDKAAIQLNNFVSDTSADNDKQNAEKFHSYLIAAPKLIETDANGNAVANGDTADCDPDFCKWNSQGYGAPLTINKEEIDLSSMAERTVPHTQPSDDEMYVLSYDWNSWTASTLHKDVFVYKGKTYTFQMFWQDNSKTTDVSVDGTNIVVGSLDRQSEFTNGATYDVQTGLLTYTFTASSNHISIILNNNFDSNQKLHCYKIANPVMFEVDENGNAVSGGDIADCDVDFCTWYEEGRDNPAFQIVKESDFGFAATVKFGDVNSDGAFNIIDLVVTKKQLANTYTGDFNYMSLGKSAADKTLTCEDLVFVKSLLLGIANGRSKAQLGSLISSLHNENGKYALGVNLAGSTKVVKSIETFENKFGEKPAYVDYDMCSLPFISESNREYLIAQLTRFNKEGGFTALTSHWLVPTQKLSETSSGGANNSRHTLTATEYAKVYTPGNDLYDNFREELAIEAEFIGKLKNYGISVIYRPLHECNYGSFWWCINTENSITPSMVATLYNYVHDYFTNDCGLDNIIWQFNADAKHDTSSLVSPANVDMLSLDCYLTDVIDLGIPADYENLSKICGDKAFAISEFYAEKPADYNYNLTSMLNEFNGKLAYKFAYLGIYCNLEELAESVLPSNVLTLSDTATR